SHCSTRAISRATDGFSANTRLFPILYFLLPYFLIRQSYYITEVLHGPYLFAPQFIGALITNSNEKKKDQIRLRILPFF
ncbi:MAG: hypothetical protein WAK52_01130, partial [Trichococcus sp.]